MKDKQTQKERLANLKPKKRTREQRIQRRLELASTFPKEGKAKAEQIAAFLDIGVSTFYKMIADERIVKPTKFGARVARWDVLYIREIGENGIPAKEGEAA